MVFETLTKSKEGAVLFAEIAAQPMNLLGPELVCHAFTSAQTGRSSFSSSSAPGPEEAGFWPVTSLPSTWTRALQVMKPETETT